MKNLLFFFLILSIAISAQNVSKIDESLDYDPSKDAESSVVLETPNQLIPIVELNRGQELRAFWVDGWNKGFLNASQVAEVIKIATTYNYNAKIVQVRRRGDEIYFPTYPNTEPRKSGLAADFDALQEIIRQAHTARLEVHAWITTFLISTSTLPSSPEHVCKKHPEYLMEDNAGNRNIGEGYYLDPGNPDALAWNGRVVMDIVKNYDIDGLHFDYVRYPQQNSGYNPTAVSRYNKEFGLSGKPAYNDEKFSQWRRKQITDWLRKMYGDITTAKPWVKVTAATFAGRSDAYSNRFQDWALWMKEGIIDANFPMNYSTSMTTYQSRVDDIMANSYGRHVYMGIGSYLITSENSILQLNYARSKNSHGQIGRAHV